RSDINEARLAAQMLAEKNVSIVLGSYRSTLSLAGGDVFEASSLPAITITNSNPLVTISNDWYFRICITETFQGVAMAKYLTEELNLSRAAIMLDSDNDYARSLAQAFSDKLAALTDNPDCITYTAEFPSDTRNYSGELLNIQASGAQVIFVPLSAETAVSIAKQADTLSIGAVFLGTELWETDELAQLASEKVLSHMYFASESGQNMASSALSREFYAAYREKYGLNSVPDPAIVLGFDAYMLALNAISNADDTSDHESIRRTLSGTRSFEGVSGHISFDQNGDTIKSVLIKSVRNGKFVNVYTAEPRWGPSTPAAITPEALSE
ncbi:MAG: ABC transporter substrate-binding protein, partial [Oscillospiraceae bacterium]|nr:ABC transporter substrate-binding protein [Oscillospiraceae bacterium]